MKKKIKLLIVECKTLEKYWIIKWRKSSNIFLLSKNNEIFLKKKNNPSQDELALIGSKAIASPVSIPSNNTILNESLEVNMVFFF